ncbi:MobQ family relaxase [Agrobacterium sp. LAD9]|uniref:MobQ family relaxase n=1 Tax=Agrobacterium sp. LAD9 TaxID=2055153 RepID=UPI001864B869|nr:MobQ family relaxase [Agrobacterium sp. LAD9]
MAIYHFSGQILGRSSKVNPDGTYRPGSKAVAAAAYRSGSRLVDGNTGEVHDYSHRRGVVHSEIMAPPGSATWVEDRQLLWSTVEAMDKRRDAQLAREFNMALPHELDAGERLELVRRFVGRHFVQRGMVADVALHDPIAEHGQSRLNFHAHVMLTLRRATVSGLDRVKTREWNSKELLNEWRAEWAVACNDALERAGKSVRIDHRTLVAQRDYARELGDMVRAAELNREPEIHVGPRARQIVRRERVPVSRMREVGPYRGQGDAKVAERRRRDYPSYDGGSRLNWLERIVVGNDQRLKRELEAVTRRFDRYQRKMDYWERRIAFWMEGQMGGPQFRFERWQEAERRKKVAHARKRFAQLVSMMTKLEDMMRLGGLQREKGLLRIRELEGWARAASERKRDRVRLRH